MTNQRISDPTRSLLELAQLRGVGPAALRKFLALYQTPLEDPFGAFQPMSKGAVDKVGLEEAKTATDQILRACQPERIVILSPWDSTYPAMLRKISDYPPLLYVRGNVEALAIPSAAVVGTRKASARGLQAAHGIARVLVQQQWAVVSGLALGIDAAAHQGALDANGVTVAVLGHGLDQINPATNSKLGLSILNTGGALVSEHPPGTPIRPLQFVQRNRIQSGLSQFSIIVESGEEGGAIHHAQLAHKQGHKVYAFLPEAPDGQFRRGGGEHLVREIRAQVLQRAVDVATACATSMTGPPQPYGQKMLF